MPVPIHKDLTPTYTILIIICQYRLELLITAGYLIAARLLRQHLALSARLFRKWRTTCTQRQAEVCLDTLM